MGEDDYPGKWILFRHRATGPKTKVWLVLSKRGEACLGRVCWYGPWRGYAFYPEGNTAFEQDCLREIADFVVARSKAHRSAMVGKPPTGNWP